MHSYYGYGFSPYHLGASVGQVPDLRSQWEQLLTRDTSTAFQEATGLPYPEDNEMQIVWLACKYAVVNSHLYRANMFSDDVTMKWADKGPYPLRDLVRWLADYKDHLKRLFADNPTWDRRAQEAVRRIKRPR